MTLSTETNIRRVHERRDNESETTASLLRDASMILEACGVVRGGSWLRRVVSDYLAAPIAGVPFGMFLTARIELNAHQRLILAQRADLRYLLSYSDPTGETAVRNVMKERGW